MNASIAQTVLDDAALPTLRAATDREVAAPQLMERLRLSDRARLTSLRVLAYKPGRRCLIEYEFASREGRHDEARLSVVGKIRVNRFGNSGYRQLRALWDAGFDDQSADRISVPKPLATVPGLCMWVQQKIDGQIVTSLLASPPAGLIDRVASAAQKMHELRVGVERRHTMDDELTILQRCLATTAAEFPATAAQCERLFTRAVQVGESLGPLAPCPSHRDFYSDQMLISGGRVYLLDFDLFCIADPGLDIGNFLGHLTEHALRHCGDHEAFSHLERELEDRFVTYAGEAVRRAVRAYAALTLTRHVYLCTRFADRVHLLPALTRLAQERLEAVMAGGTGA